MPLNPPFCLEVRCDLTAINVNLYTVTFTATSSQGYGSGTYDCRNIATGMWFSNLANGYAWKVYSISAQNISTCTCVIEDVDGFNAIIDPSGGIDGGAPGSNVGYIYELNANGLPVLHEIPNPPSVVWSDTQLARFLYTQTGATGGSGTGPTGPAGTSFSNTILFYFDTRGTYAGPWTGQLDTSLLLLNDTTTPVGGRVDFSETSLNANDPVGPEYTCILSETIYAGGTWTFKICSESVTPGSLWYFSVTDNGTEVYQTANITFAGYSNSPPTVVSTVINHLFSAGHTLGIRLRIRDSEFAGLSLLTNNLQGLNTYYGLVLIDQNYGGTTGPTGMSGPTGQQGPTGPSGDTKSFTLYVAYSDQTNIYSVRVPPGLFKPSTGLSAGGLFTSDQAPYLLFQTNAPSPPPLSITLSDTTYESLASFSMLGFLTVGEWRQVPSSSFTSTRVYTSFPALNSVKFNNINLSSINGGNTAVTSTFPYTGDVLAITVTFV